MALNSKFGKVNARRFAALFAGFDLGNASDEEGLAKALALRHMASSCHMRIVDLLELPEVRQAVDAQMQPKRQPGPEAQAAQAEAASLRQELLERTREARELAEALTATRMRMPGAPKTSDAHSLGAQTWVIEVVVVVVAIELLVIATFH